MRLDLFGKQIESADFRLFPRNREYIGEHKVYKRSLRFAAENDGIYEYITFFERNTKYLLLADFEENGHYADSACCFNGDELNYESGLIFVDDLNDNDKIKEKVLDWHECYMSDVENEWIYSENNPFQKIQYKNPLTISSKEL
jgi:hypothetical protein